VCASACEQVQDIVKSLSGVSRDYVLGADPSAGGARVEAPNASAIHFYIGDTHFYNAV